MEVILLVVLRVSTTKFNIEQMVRFDRQLALQAAQRIVSDMIQAPLQEVQYLTADEPFYKFVRPESVLNNRDVRFLRAQVRALHDLHVFEPERRPRDYAELDKTFEEVFEYVESITVPFTMQDLRYWPELFQKLENLERHDSRVDEAFSNTSRALSFA